MRPALTATLLLLLTVAAAAQDAPGEIHRKIYVPLDEWEAVLAEEPRGLMITRREYDDLLERARRTLSARGEGTLPPVGAVVSKAHYEARLEGARCIAVADLAIEFLREGWVLVPVGLEGTAPSEARLGDEAALLHRARSGGFHLVARGEGKGTLKIPFSTRAQETAEGYLIRFGLVPSAAGTFTFRAPGEWEIADAGGSGQAVFDGEAKETRFTAPTGGRDRITLHLSRRKLGREDRPIILLEKDLTLLIDESGIEAAWDLRFTVLREKTAALALGLPAGFDLAEVSSPDLLDWRVLPDGTLRLTFQKETQGVIPVKVRMRAGLPAGGGLQSPHLAGVEVDREWGRMQILLLGGMRARLASAEGAREIPRHREEKSHRPSAGDEAGGAVAVFRSFAWTGDAPSVTLDVERPPARLHGDVRTLVRVGEDGIRLRSLIGYTAVEGEVLTLHPQLPPDLDLFSLEGLGVEIEWRQEEEGRVWVGLESKLSGKGKVFLAVEGRLPGGAEIQVPRILAGAEREEGYLAFAVEGGYSLLGREISGLDPIDAREASRLLGPAAEGARLLYSYVGGDYAGKVLVREETPEINLDTVQYVSFMEDKLETHIKLGYEILRAGARQILFRLPKGTGERIDLQGEGIKEKARTEEEEYDLWKITFQAPVLGRRDLFLTFQRELAEVEEIPEVTAIGVARQLGFLAVEASAESEIKLTPPEWLPAVDPAEVPEHGRYRPGRKIIAAWRYASADHGVGIQAERHEKGEVGTALVSDFEADVQVNPWGDEKVTATYKIRQTSLQSLEFDLPRGSRLWAARLDGVGVKPAEAGRTVLIPLEGEGPEERTVELLYSTGRRSGFRVSSALPSVAYPVRMAAVTMHVPGDRVVLWAGGEYRPEFHLGGRSGFRFLWERHRGTVMVFLLILGHAYLFFHLRHRVREAIFAARLRFGRTTLLAGVILLVMVVVFALSKTNMLMESRKGVAPGLAMAPETAGFRVAPLSKRQAGGGGGPAEKKVQVESEAGAEGLDMAHQTLGAPRPGEERPGDRMDAYRRELGAEDEEAEKEVRSGEGAPATARPARRAGAKYGGLRGPELDLRGLASLAIDFPETGGTLAFSRQGTGGGARIWLVGTGTYRFLAVLTFLGCLLGGLVFARSGRAAGIVLILIGLAAVPELMPTLSVITNAGIAGLALGLLFAGVAWIVRRISLTRIGGAAALTLLVLLPAGGAWAQEEPQDPEEVSRLLGELLEEGEPRAPRSERRVFIPFDPGDPAGLDEGKEIYVPYDEFIRLWELAHDGNGGVVPPLPFAVGSARYEALLDGDLLKVTARFLVRSIHKGWTEVPLGLGGARIQAVKVNGGPGSLRESEGGFSFLAEAAGTYRVEVALEAQGKTRGGKGEVTLDLAGSPVSTLTLRVADPERRCRIENAPSGQWVENGHIRADLGAIPRARITWESGVGVAAEVALRARTFGLLHLGEGYVRLVQKTTFETSGGKVDTFRFRIDDGFRVHDVLGKGVRSWGLEAGHLEVSLFQPREGKIPIQVVGEATVRDGKASLPMVQPQGVLGERGGLLLETEGHLQVRVSRLAGLRTVERDGWTGPAPRGEVVRFYRFVARPVELEAEVRSRGTESSAVVRQDLTVSPREVIQVVSVRETVKEGQVFGREIQVSPGLQLEGTSGPVRDAWLDDSAVLHLVFQDGISGNLSYGATLRRREAEDQGETGIPLAWVRGPDRQRGLIAVRGRGGIRLLSKDLKGLRSTDPRRAQRKGQPAPDLVLLYTEAYSGVLGLVQEEADLTASWTLHVEAAGDVLELAARIIFKARQGSADTLSFALPASVEETLVRPVGDGLRETSTRVEGERRIWTVTLQKPLSGEYPLRVYLDLEYESGEPLALPWLSFPGIDEREGYILIGIEGSFAKIDWSGEEELESIPTSRLPALPPGVEANQILRAYRKVGSPWSLSLAVTPLKSEWGPGIRIDYLKMETVVQEDGLSWNRASYRIWNRERQFIHLTLPPKADLLSVFVAEEASRPALAGEEGEGYLIPLPMGAVGDLAFGVDLIYTLPLSTPGGLSAVVPRTPDVHDVEVSRVFWTLTLPESVRPLYFGGDMQEVGAEVIPTLELQEEVRDLELLARLSETGNEVQQMRAGMNLARQFANVQEKLSRAQQMEAQVLAQEDRKANKQFLANAILLDQLAEKSEQYKSKTEFGTLQADVRDKSVADPGAYGKQVEETLRKNIQQKKKERRRGKWEAQEEHAQQDADLVAKDVRGGVTRGYFRRGEKGDAAAEPAQDMPQERARLKALSKGQLGEPPAATKAPKGAVGGRVAGAVAAGKPGFQGQAAAPRQVAALSIRMDLPTGGRAYYFKKEGEDASLTARTSSRSWEGTTATLIKILALAALFGAALRLGWFREERLRSFVGAGVVVLVLLVVSAMVASATVSVAVLGMAGFFLWRERP